MYCLLFVLQFFSPILKDLFCKGSFTYEYQVLGICNHRGKMVTDTFDRSMRGFKEARERCQFIIYVQGGGSPSTQGGRAKRAPWNLTPQTTWCEALQCELHTPAGVWWCSPQRLRVQWSLGRGSRGN